MDIAVFLAASSAAGLVNRSSMGWADILRIA
jgi:hypothetical protein